MRPIWRAIWQKAQQPPEQTEHRFRRRPCAHLAALGVCVFLLSSSVESWAEDVRTQSQSGRMMALDGEPLVLKSRALGEAVYMAEMGNPLQGATILMAAAERGTDRAQVPQRVLYLSSLLWELGLTDRAAQLLEAGVANISTPAHLQMLRVQQGRMALREPNLYDWSELMADLEPPAHAGIAQATLGLDVQYAINQQDWAQARRTFLKLPASDPQTPFYFQKIFMGLYQAGNLSAWKQWLSTGFPGSDESDANKVQHVGLDADRLAARETVKVAQKERWILQQAFAAVSSESFERAETLFDQIRAKSPWLVEALFGKVMMFLRQTSVQEAFEAWRVMLDRTPDDLQTLTAGLLIAQAFERESAFDDALLVLDAQVPYLKDFQESFSLLQDTAQALPIEAPPEEWHPIAQRYWHDLAADPVWQQGVAQWRQLKMAAASVAENKRRLAALRTAFEWQQSLRAQKASQMSLDQYVGHRGRLVDQYGNALTDLNARLLAFDDLALASPETQEQWQLVEQATERLARIEAAQADFPQAAAARRKLAAARGLLRWQAYEESLDRGWRVLAVAQENEIGLDEAQVRLNRITQWVKDKKDLNISQQRLDAFAQRLAALEASVSQALVAKEQMLIDHQVAFFEPKIDQLTRLEQDIRFAAARVADAHWADRQESAWEAP